MSALQRVVSVLFSPTKTFREIAERPTWVAPFLVLLICGGAAGWVVVHKIDTAAQSQMIRDKLEERGSSGAELDRQVEQISSVNAKIRPFYPVIGLVFSVIGYLLITLVLWGGFSLAGGTASWSGAFSTTLHGLIPQAIKALVMIPVAAGHQTIDPMAAQTGSFLASNLAAFAPEDAAAWLKTLLSSADFFTIWSVALLAIGFAITARVSKGTATAVVIACWALGIALHVGWVAVFG